MTYYVSSGTLNLTKPKPKPVIIIIKAICNAQDPLKKAANALSGS